MVTELDCDDFQIRGPAYPGCQRRVRAVGLEFLQGLDRQQFVYLTLEQAADLHHRLGELLVRLTESQGGEEP